jgi:hypothetical protein
MMATQQAADRSGSLGGEAVGGVMEIYPGNSQAVSFTRARVKDPLNYFEGTNEFWKRADANILE